LSTDFLAKFFPIAPARLGLLKPNYLCEQSMAGIKCSRCSGYSPDRNPLDLIERNLVLELQPSTDLYSRARFTFTSTAITYTCNYMTTIKASKGRRELQVEFVGLGKMGRPMAIRVKTAVYDLWGRDIMEEALL
jgi:hypothetical protein